MENNIYHYASVSQALEELKEKDFTYSFNLHEEDITKPQSFIKLAHIYRYEGNTNPDDRAVVYRSVQNMVKILLFSRFHRKFS
jgi:hypothetical protein